MRITHLWDINNPHTGFYLRQSNAMKNRKLINVLATNLTRLMEGSQGLRTIDQLSKKSGVGRGTVDRVKKGEVSTTLDKVEAIADAFGVSAASLLSTYAENLGQTEKSKLGYVRFPLVDAPHGMGGNLAPADNPEILQYVEVNEDWARGTLHANFSQIKIVPGIGDSMSGTIEDGSVVFVDTGTRHFAGDGLYAIVWQGRLQIKRLQAKHDEKRLKIISDNKLYDADWATDDLIISGRVLAAWNFKRF
ncbi:S24 family peptidase [Glaciimonas sp. PCH181]|uniref:XRE family transcriptional regulator n=1 Tax=Glaciimonas sp. PCH181 TaxID=2133943 RepID=UPI000D3C4625|nr:S24 family peptidase [Glaciimonas sp. PCH181]PUA19608.1 hypothetical protein C7W93_07120 [Glaciimonas sp. PCH181]